MLRAIGCVLQVFLCFRMIKGPQPWAVNGFPQVVGTLFFRRDDFKKSYSEYAPIQMPRRPSLPHGKVNPTPERRKVQHVSFLIYLGPIHGPLELLCWICGCFGGHDRLHLSESSNLKMRRNGNGAIQSYPGPQKTAHMRAHQEKRLMMTTRTFHGLLLLLRQRFFVFSILVDKTTVARQPAATFQQRSAPHAINDPDAGDVRYGWGHRPSTAPGMRHASHSTGICRHKKLSTGFGTPRQTTDKR
jgi:hypothetical protein